MKLTLNKEEMKHLYNIEHFLNVECSYNTKILFSYKLYNLCCILDDNDIVELAVSKDEAKQLIKHCVRYVGELNDSRTNKMTFAIMEKCKLITKQKW